MVDNQVLWRAYRDRYAQSMAEGAEVLPERKLRAITSLVANRGAPDGDAEALRPVLARAVARLQAEPPSSNTVVTILAAAKVGIDPAPALEAIRLTGLDRDTQTDILEEMRSGLCAFPSGRREQLAPAIIPALRDARCATARAAVREVARF
jgi:hypothetical protein